MPGRKPPLSPHHFIRSSVLVVIFTLLSLSPRAQEIKKGDVYALGRKIVDTLSSPSFHGRGYVNGGDSIAADFIKSAFIRFGVKAYKNRYYQPVSFPVNIFDGVSMYVDGKGLAPGKDFIPIASSPSASGKFQVVYLDDVIAKDKKKFRKFKKQDLSDKILVVNDTGKQDIDQAGLQKAAATIYLRDKLTWTVSRLQQSASVFEVLRSSMTGTPKEIQFLVKSHLDPKHNTQNVIGYVPGKSVPDSFIVFSAHYDHLGRLGQDVYFPGANDNASGCAMLLNLARHYARPENQPKYSMLFIFFCGEEAGLVGSRHFVEHPPMYYLKSIKLLFNMDIMGTGEEGITVVNGSVYKNEFDLLKKINDENKLIKDVKIRGKAANSDHYHFSEKGVKSFFIYTMGGTKAYHDIYDKGPDLPLNEFEDLFTLITKFATEIQK